MNRPTSALQLGQVCTASFAPFHKKGKKQHKIHLEREKNITNKTSSID